MNNPVFTSVYIKGFSALVVCCMLSMMAVNQGCSKDKLITSPGVIINTGSFSSGGCEWIILVGLDRYQPDNLPNEFMQTQVDSLPVEITFRVVRRIPDCPLANNYSGLIHLNRIKQI